MRQSLNWAIGKWQVWPHGLHRARQVARDFSKIKKKTQQVTLLALPSLLLSGCISYQAEQGAISKAVHDTGVLQQVELGKTTTDWLIAQFGQPQAVRRPSSAIAIWQYENVHKHSRKVRALPLLSIHLTEEEREIFNFEVENDFVVRFWRDTAAQE